MSFFSKMIDKSISFCFIAYSKLACQQAIRWNDRASGFLKKNERACVWAASCERSFGGMHFSAGGVRRYNKVGASAARSVPSKLQHCHSTLGHSPHILFPCVPPLYATYTPPIHIGTSSESHRNLIGTLPNDERIIKQLSPRLQQLFFDMTKPEKG